MPQPLSSVCPNAKTNFAPEALRHFPEFAIMMMRTIETWSHIDGNTVYLFSRFLRTDIRAATTVFQTFNSARQRQTALLAAAESALPDWQRHVLKAVLAVIEPSRRVRNAFAHQIIGRSDALPSALLLVDAAVLSEANVSYRQKTKHRADGGGVIAPQEIDHEKVMVWRENDFVRATKDAEVSENLFSVLCMTIGYGANEMARRDLLSRPQVQTKLKKVISVAEPLLAAQLRPPDEGEPPAPGVWEVWDQKLGRDMTVWESRDL